MNFQFALSPWITFRCHFKQQNLLRNALLLPLEKFRRPMLSVVQADRSCLVPRVCRERYVLIWIREKNPRQNSLGLTDFFSKSQRTDGNEEAHKTAGRGGRQIPVITASSTASTSAAHGQPVEPSIMLQRVEEKFPESRNGKAFHSYYHCNGQRCSMSDPAYLSSSNGKIAR